MRVLAQGLGLGGWAWAVHAAALPNARLGHKNVCNKMDTDCAVAAAPTYHSVTIVLACLPACLPIIHSLPNAVARTEGILDGRERLTPRNESTANRAVMS